MQIKSVIPLNETIDELFSIEIKISTISRTVRRSVWRLKEIASNGPV